VTLAGEARVPVLGLMPNASYTLRAIAWGRTGMVEGPAVPFATGALPGDIPEYIAGGSSPSPGYVAFAVGSYGVVVNNAGRVVWYRRFSPGPGLNFQAQPTGRFVARPPQASPSEPGAWLEIDPVGNMTRTLGCAGSLQPRFHDLLAERDGSYWILCDEIRTMDLSAIGGSSAARVTGTVVQHVSDAGALLFQWSVFDYFDIADLDPAERAGATVNWTHGNALDLDGDGNVLVSFRNLSEVTKIDTRTGRVVWRMGGVRNEFGFQETAAPAFSRQHGLRVTGPNEILLLDNLGEPGGSRVERYRFDPEARTARLIASYASAPAVTAQLGGTTQELPGARVLVSFGDAAKVEEYDGAGNVVWRIERPGYVFRAQRILSLYAPGAGTAR
jgi:hypothetical protein